jgi:hypothetical protein
MIATFPDHETARKAYQHLVIFIHNNAGSEDEDNPDAFDVDWDLGDFNIGLDGYCVNFNMYSAGYGTEAIQEQVQKFGGDLNYQETPYVVPLNDAYEDIKEELGLGKDKEWK